MSGQLPIIDELDALDTAMAVADWLQRCPFSVIAQNHDAIRNVLIRKRFAEAVDCLDAELALACSTRGPDGTFQQGPNFSAHAARGAMRVAARGFDGIGEGGR